MDYHRPTVGYFKENYVLVHGECCYFWEDTKINLKNTVIKKKDGLDGLDFESKPKSESREPKSESKSKSRELESKSKSAESKKVDLSPDSTSSPDSSPPALLHNYGDI